MAETAPLPWQERSLVRHAPNATRARAESSLGACRGAPEWRTPAERSERRLLPSSEQVQGDEFKHITVVLDKKFCPAAGYTALSRVEKGADYALAGKVTREHFVPATWMDPA